jgi:N-acetylglucosamine-6-sulfatase
VSFKRWPRRRPASGFIALFAAAVIASTVVTAPEGTTARATDRPSVVVVMTDDQTVEQMRVMKHVRSRIGARGTTFTSSFANFPLCCPSRATFLTGQYAHNHGVLGNSAPQGGFRAFRDRRTLATWLQDAGYRTALVGKYLSQTPRHYIPPGWNEWYGASGGTTQMVYDYTLNQNGRLVQYGTRPRDFKTDVLTTKAVRFIRRQAPRTRPFFLFVAYTAPHGGGPDPSSGRRRDCANTTKRAPRHRGAFEHEPLPRPPNFNERDTSDKPGRLSRRPRMRPRLIREIERRYRCRLESLLSVDEGVRDIVDTLARRNELDNTLVIFTSDNGLLHGEHRIWTGKDAVYDEVIGVPLMIRGPGIPQGATVTSPVVNADLAPTIADATGANPTLPLDGRSLLPMAQDPGLGQGRGVLIEHPGRYAAIRTARYLYARHAGGGRELYDMRADPFQLRSRHDDPDFAQIKAELAARLAELRDCSGRSCQR